MSKYTTEVRFICENSAGLTESVGYNSINEVLDKSRAKVFDFDFPIFDEAYRAVLENKILKHYYTREICCETVGLWKHFLDTRMNEIMPYYNQLYKSALLEFNPLYDVDLTTDYQKVDNGNNDKTRDSGENGTFTETNTIDETVVLDENKQHSNTNVVDENTSNTNTAVVNENISNSNTNVVDENTSNSNTNVVDENIRGTETDSTTQETDGTNGNTTTDNRANKNDHWEYFSDTPEGGINGVANLNYLTNATHITDDGTGSTSTNTSIGTTHSETETVANKTNNGERDVTTTDNGSGELDRTTTENGSGELDRTTTENGSGELDRTTTDNGTNETDATTTKDSTTEKSGNNSKTINENTKETIKNIEDYLQHVVGKRGAASYSKLLLEYRDTFLNIDLMVIRDLKDLFMNIW